MQILAGLLKPTGGFVYVKKPKSFVFQNPDHQVIFGCVSLLQCYYFPNLWSQIVCVCDTSIRYVL